MHLQQSIKHHYKDLSYALVRSRRKTLSIYIERDGSITLRVPQEMKIPDIEKIIEKKRFAIYKQLALWEQLNASRIEREFVNGESFFYLGSSYRLEIVEQQDIPLKLFRGYFYLRKSEISRGPGVFKDFYRQKGKEKLPQRVAFYKGGLGVEPQGIRVLDLGNHWGSCTKTGVLNFHWKCMMAPLAVIDYIVVHEMAHMLHRRHTEAFYEVVDKVLPDYRERKNWLTLHGASLDL
jgi:predicted metal-dependent hydrolase